MQQHASLIAAGGLSLLGGLLMFCTELLSEILIGTYFESQGRRIYAAVRDVVGRRGGVIRETPEIGLLK
jgi:hypothetical protein